MKRGASELVAWVLVIGFSVTLGLVVTQWMRTQAETSTDVVTRDIERDLRCGDVSFNARFVSCGMLEVSNRGYHTIALMKMRTPYDVQEIATNLAPGATATVSVQGVQSGYAIDLIPVITVDNERLGCLDRKLALAC